MFWNLNAVNKQEQIFKLPVPRAVRDITNNIKDKAKLVTVA